MTISMDPRLANDFDVVGAVRKATETASKRTKAPTFSFSKASPGEAFTAVLFGIYLAYAVGRLPEVFEGLQDIPRLPMIMMLIFLAILGLTVPGATWQNLWRSSPVFRYVSMLGLLGIATAPFGIWTSGSIYQFRTKYVIALAVFYCCVVFLRDRKNLRRAVSIYVLCVGAVAVDTARKYDPNKILYDENGIPLEDQGSIETRRVTVGDSLDPNDFGAILAVTFPLALWLGVGSVRRRIFWSALALAMVLAVVTTSSRGSLLGFLAVATVLIGIGARGWRRFLTILMIAAGVAAFAYTANSAQMDRFTDYSGSDYNLTSSGGRWHFWKQGMIWMIKRPWGYGLENYPTYFDILNGEGRAAHSTWVQYGMELGVAGLALYLMIHRWLIGALLKLRRRAIHFRDTDEEVLASHTLAMLAGLLVTGTFLSNAYHALTYMPIGIAVAVLIGTRLPELPVAAQSVSETPPSTHRRSRIATTTLRKA